MFMKNIQQKINRVIQYIVNSPKGVFFCVTLMIILPMWQSGYLFFLDWSVDVAGVQNVDFWQHSILKMLLIMLSGIINYGLYQKIIITLILFSLGMGGYLFSKEIVVIVKSENINKYIKRWVYYLGGLFMMINPFIYERLVDGQWIVAGSVVGVLFMIIFLLRWYKNNKRKNIIFAIVWSTCTVMLSQHAIFFVMLVSLMFFIIVAIKRNDFRVMFLWGWLIFFVIFFNINIMGGYVFNLTESSNVVAGFDDKHLHAFRTTKNGYASIYLNTISLHGYWGEREDRFISTQNNPYVWISIFIIFSSLVLVGVWFSYKNIVGKFLLWTGIGAYILAMGTESFFGPVVSLLYRYIPFYIGLREPHKWDGIWLICFSGLVSYGVLNIMMRQQKKYQTHLFGVFVVILIYIYIPTMLWGFNKQLIPQDFPTEWYEVKEMINCGNINGKILFLPWHQYMKIDFLNEKKIINPANAFFGKCVIQGDNMEAKNIYTQVHSSNSEIITKYIKTNRPNRKEFIADINRLSIKYIILSKSEDFESYLWLNDMHSLEKIKSGKYLVIYKVWE